MSVILDICCLWVLGVLGLAVVLSFIRLAKGPTAADRVVALDLISTEGIGIIVIYAITMHKQVLLDVAIMLALISFLGTVAFARYLEIPLL